LGATGLLPVELRWFGCPICAPATLRVIPAGPQVPRIVGVSDGINLMAGLSIETRIVKVTLEEIERPDEVQAKVDGQPVLDLEWSCAAPRLGRFEVNFRLPEAAGAGRHQLQLNVGRRSFAPVLMEVV